VNVDKLDVHAVTPEEVEDVFDDKPCILRHPKHAGRYIALCFGGDRFLLVIFEYRRQVEQARVVTAYEPTSSRWWRIYEAKSHTR
jgi:hypothetical protein